jgi:hypothetical protein
VGWCYLQVGQTDKCMQCCDESLILWKANARASYLRFKAHLSAGSVDLGWVQEREEN